MKNRSVGLVVMTEMPGLGLVAVLRERGYFNPETMGPETRPGACQVTAHGQVDEDESFVGGIVRETTEELGEGFTFLLLGLIATERAELEEVVRAKVSSSTGPKEIVTFAVKVDCSLLKKIRLAPESGAIRLLTRTQLQDVVDMNGFDRMEGVKDRGVIAMFPDALQAVTRAFDRFSND